MGDVHAMSSGIQCPRSCAGYSAATGTLVGWGGAADCEAVVVPHAQSDQAVASSTMACMRFVRRKRFMDPKLPRPCWRIQADRKSTRLNSVTNAHLVCRLLLEKQHRNNNYDSALANS